MKSPATSFSKQARSTATQLGKQPLTPSAASERVGQAPVGQRRAVGSGCPATPPAGQAMVSDCPRLRGPLQLQKRISAAIEQPDTASVSQLKAGAARSVGKQSGVLQRVINTRLPVKFYRREGGSASSRLNIDLDNYNQASKASNPSPDILLQKLAAIERKLPDVSSKKQVERDKIAAEIRAESELLRQKSEYGKAVVAEVMHIANAKARGQLAAPKTQTAVDNRELATYIATREVLHATNPLKLVKNTAIGDLLAQQGEIKNIHQTHQSLVGSDKDGDKRLVTEVGLFYPEKYRRPSFSRLSHLNSTTTKGIESQPPAYVLPIYGALSLENGPSGAFPTASAMSLHFVIKPEVVRARATFTSSDSLQQWIPYESGFSALCQNEMLPKNACEASKIVPTDGNPWNMGPLATYETGNFGQLLKHASQDPAACLAGKATTPINYIEAQIHGGLRIGEDISHVRANFAKLYGHPGFEALYNSLREKRIPIHWYYASKGEREQGKEEEQGQFIEDWEEQHKVANARWQEASNMRRSQYERVVKSKRISAENKSIRLKFMQEKGDLLDETALCNMWKASPKI